MTSVTGTLAEMVRVAMNRVLMVAQKGAKRVVVAVAPAQKVVKMVVVAAVVAAAEAVAETVRPKASANVSMPKAGRS